VIEHVPAPVTVTTFPLIVHTAAGLAPKLTASPDDAVALTANGAAP
jgi:hypothetical protein